MVPESALDFHEVSVSATKIETILPLREMHRQEMNCQIIQDSFPQRSLSDPYAALVDGKIAGYGLVANKYYLGAVTEFYLIPGHRRQALPVFRELLKVTQAS